MTGASSLRPSYLRGTSLCCRQGCVDESWWQPSRAPYLRSAPSSHHWKTMRLDMSTTRGFRHGVCVLPKERRFDYSASMTRRFDDDKQSSRQRHRNHSFHHELQISRETQSQRLSKTHTHTHLPTRSKHKTHVGLILPGLSSPWQRSNPL